MYQHLHGSFQAAKTPLLVALALLFSGCATNGHRAHANMTSSMELGAGSPEVRAHNLITERELAAFPAQDELTAYDAIRRLRPEFLLERAAIRGYTQSIPVVFVDGLREGSPEVLRSLRASWVREVKYYGPVESYSRFGSLAPAGAIVVTLVKR